MKVYTYSRTSTNKQENSINMQSNQLFEYCERKGFTDVIHLVESDVSGGKSLFHRPEGSKLENLEEGDWIIALKHDRLFRETENGIRLVKRWFRAGVNIVFLNISEQPINIKNPAAKFSFFIMLCTAEYEKDMIGQRTKEGFANLKRQGKPSGRASFGRKNIFTLNENNKKLGVSVQIDEDQAKILQYAYDLRQDGLSYAKIAKRLNDKQMYTQTGKKWNHGNLPTIIENGIKSGVIKIKELCTH